MPKKRILIIGAAGRDFHNFNVAYRRDKQTEVVAFTAAQIPGIADRRYPAELAGKTSYPHGIPIEEEKNLEKIIKERKIDECVFSYSDVSYDTLMNIGSRVLSAGAKFSLLGPNQTMLKSKKPIVAVVAVRTGCGKSPTTRRVVEILREAEKRVVVIRHPMPYGDLKKQELQRFQKMEDLEKNHCTIEEMEEYEPHIAMNSIVYAGVDYEKILKRAEKEADVIVWDGGNNDLSFYRPDLTITVADPHRAGHEIRYYPGNVNFRLADAIVITKVNSADPESVKIIIKNAKQQNPSAKIIKAESIFKLDNPWETKWKKALVIEDGPTMTHGGAGFGAGFIVARNHGAAIIDPRPYAVGSIGKIFTRYPHIGLVLPAMGYGEKQMKELEKTIALAECDVVVVATPINLARHIKIRRPYVRVEYDLFEKAKKELKKIMKEKKII